MSEQFQSGISDFRVPDLIDIFQPLPGWLADRLLRPDEKVSWVRGPWFTPSWERYITHPGLFFLAIALGAFGVTISQLMGGKGSEIQIIAYLAAGALVFTSIVALGISNGYFTRLVVTNFRLVILQGYEICRSWKIDDLPPSWRRYTRRGEQESWSIDLNAVKTMLGGSNGHFTDSKTILSFGKELDRIMTRDKDGRRRG